ncbi:ferric-uptake regulator [Lucifera butyrica]|uniref:Ferric-uptake regulator n=1 Tax=Lucifera butyrica TaxID=1351585 RepID=A0A498RKP3_9FIRM|nr:Fur family transcriptional regulator [Lucifera butyrica]VBB09628.1 ferric-uptake regulator [Lucifera butyrica]
MTEKIIQMLRDRGCKITPQRRAIIQVLASFDKFPTAQEILDHIHQKDPDVGLDTVYRNLNLLISMGVINQISVPGKDLKVFELAHDKHHHHLVCLGCGEANCLNYCPIDDSEIQKSAGPGFKIVGHSLEIYGYCPKCRAAAR